MKAPPSHLRLSGGASSATPASSRALARILPVAFSIAAGAPPDGAVLYPWPSPKRSVSAGTTFTSRAGTPSWSATSCAYCSSLPSASVVRLSTILPVGWTRRKTARYASPLTGETSSLVGFAPSSLGLTLEPQALLVRGQGVVLLEVAEGRGRAAQHVGRDHRALAPRVDADLGRRGAHGPHPGVVLPRLGP